MSEIHRNATINCHSQSLYSWAFDWKKSQACRADVFGGNSKLWARGRKPYYF